jgi:MoaA/NifB/PqqE/SkfB family radical SAM enzyme
MSVEYNIISDTNKRSLLGEIIVTLFEQCNMSCKFCNQDHASTVGMNNIRDKLSIVQNAIKHLQANGRTQFSVHFMGGEVFSDLVPDSCFDDYKYLADELDKWSKENKYEVEVCFTTNFVYERTDRLQKLLDECPQIVLLTSYDPSGRFGLGQLNQFKKNVVQFEKYIKSANVIMTKPNIDKFLKGDIPFFDYLYERYDIYFDYYTPEKNRKLMTPNDIQLRDFMKFMVDNYPNCLPFKDYPSKQKKRMTCQDTFTIMPDGLGGFCTILLNGELGNWKPTKEEMEQKWFEEYNCLECPHFQRCSMGCFLSNHLQSFRTQEACWLAEVYDYVDAKR